MDEPMATSEALTAAHFDPPRNSLAACTRLRRPPNCWSAAASAASLEPVMSGACRRPRPIVDRLSRVDRGARGRRTVVGRRAPRTVLAESLGAEDGFLNDSLSGFDRGSLAPVLAAVSPADGGQEHRPTPILFDEDSQVYRKTAALNFLSRCTTGRF